MTQQHPITPPPELVQQWTAAACEEDENAWNYFATWAAQWGADQELEACLNWLTNRERFPVGHEAIEDLKADRRPKPPSLKEQALLVLDDANLDAAHHNILLCALEQLDD